jgi:uroporphyrin-III C-methyltransferase/precorrin-2 dehydrogenase/sirohydrochlorin ferrochelatase
VAGYPLVVELAGRCCIVVGGGAVAGRKVEGLLAAGAAVTVVSPTLSDGLATLARAGKIRHRRRRYRRGDLVGATLAFVATGDPRIAAAVAREGRRCRVWVNAADDPEHCDFFLPSVLRRGPLVVAVATGGASPALARAVREEIERLLPADHAALAETVAGVRRELRGRGLHPDPSTWSRALSAEIRRLTTEGWSENSRERLLENLKPAMSRSAPASPGCAERGGRRSEDAGDAMSRGAPASPGCSERRGAWGARSRPPMWSIAIVGAGPGDPGLITVRGLELLRRAEVIVYDRLVNPKLLDEAATDAPRVFVGKACGAHVLAQHEINALLIDQARRGRRVVRLKGGDPFVFGRGGEEALALAEAGLAFEVVPGVSSAIAVPAAAGIPLTHRGVASSFAVVTGHQEVAGSAPATDWSRLAGSADTLVILMGLANLRAITRELIAHGRDPRTPAALIERGTTEAQRTVTAELAGLADAAAAARVDSPAVAVIGNVVSLRPRLADVP